MEWRLLAGGVLAATAVGLVLTGCSSSTAAKSGGATSAATVAAVPTPTPSSTRSSAVRVSGKPGARVYDLSGTKGAGFVSPSGNVGCAIWTRRSGLYDATYTRCDVRHHTYAPPPEPAGCGTDYGQSIGMAASPRFLCAGDTLLDYANLRDRGLSEYTAWFDPQQDPAVGHLAGLAYGNSITVDQVTCQSTRSGVDCRNTRTGAGFLIATNIYRLIPAR